MKRQIIFLSFQCLLDKKYFVCCRLPFFLINHHLIKNEKNGNKMCIRDSNQYFYIQPLIGSFTFQDYANRSPQQHDIQPDTPIMNIPAIHTDTFRIVYITAPADLPHSCNSGKYAIVCLLYTSRCV